MSLIEIQELKKYFSTPAGVNHAVDGVSMKIEAGRTMGVVGESGCGKSTLGSTIIRLLDATGGKILLNGGLNRYALCLRGTSTVRNAASLLPLQTGIPTATAY